MAYLTDVEFDAITAQQATITLRFERPVTFDVRQSANEYLLTVTIDASMAPTPTTTPTTAPTTALTTAPTTALDAPVPQTPAAVDVDKSTILRRSRNEGPSRLIQRPTPSRRDKFVIRLSDLGSADDVDRDALKNFRSQVIYMNDVTVGEVSNPTIAYLPFLT